MSIQSDGYAGISFIKDGKHLGIYSTDGRTLSWALLPLDAKSEFPDRLDVSERFCEQVVAICGEGGQLYLADDRIMAVSAEGVLVYSRVLNTNKELDYVATVERLWPPDDAFAPIPGRLSMALERAQVLSGGAKIEKATFSTTPSELRINLVSPLGHLAERIPLEAKLKEQEHEYDCAMIRRGKGMKFFAMTADCFAMEDGEGRGFIISALG